MGIADQIAQAAQVSIDRWNKLNALSTILQSAIKNRGPNLTDTEALLSQMVILLIEHLEPANNVEQINQMGQDIDGMLKSITKLYK